MLSSPGCRDYRRNEDDTDVFSCEILILCLRSKVIAAHQNIVMTISLLSTIFKTEIVFSAAKQ